MRDGRVGIDCFGKEAVFSGLFVDMPRPDGNGLIGIVVQNLGSPRLRSEIV